MNFINYYNKYILVGNACKPDKIQGIKIIKAITKGNNINQQNNIN